MYVTTHTMRLAIEAAERNGTDLVQIMPVPSEWHGLHNVRPLDVLCRVGSTDEYRNPPTMILPSRER